MNYIEYLRKKFQSCKYEELALLQLKARMLQRSKNNGAKSLGDSYELAITYILKGKPLDYYRKFLYAKERLYEQKRIYKEYYEFISLYF